MILPNFIILGAAKAGTTAVYHYMRQHPQIGMSRIKETNYFALEGHALDFHGPGDREFISRFSVTTAEGYQEQFRDVADRPAIGEASPLYLYDPAVPARLAAVVPKARLIVILRDPVDRAFSAFCHLVRDHRETTRDFAEALRLEDQRIAAGWEHIWHYCRMGQYHDQLRRYLEHYPADQIRIHLYDDFQADPATILTDLFGFIGVDPSFRPDMATRHNSSDLPRERRPTLSPAARTHLRAALRDDTTALQTLLGRDLAGWLDRSEPASLNP